MSSIRPEDQIFFLYDHSTLQKEEDDLKDAIKYFFPSSISVDDQCALCGQLMGMAEYFQNFLGKTPKLFKLKKNKVAVKHVGKYTLAMAGNLQEPDNVIYRQLESLYGLFLFYQGGMEQLLETCQKEKRDFLNVMQSVWDCYLPFIRRYGDSLTASFESIPTIELPKNMSSLFLQATHLLQYTGKQPGVLCGCLLYKGRVLCTQLPPNITARILIIRPKQSHFPCRQISPDFQLPAGIRILSVFVTMEEYSQIDLDNKYEKGKIKKKTDVTTTPERQRNGEQDGLRSDTPSVPSLNMSSIKQSDSETSPKTKAQRAVHLSSENDSDTTTRSEADDFSILKDGVVSVNHQPLEDTKPLDVSPDATDTQSQPFTEGKVLMDDDDGTNLGDIKLELTKDASESPTAEAPAEEGQSQISETEGEIKEHAKDVSEIETEVKVEITEAPSEPSQADGTTVKGEEEEVLIGKHVGEEVVSPKKSKSKSTTATLFKNLKIVAAKNSNVLENITRQMEMENALESDEEDTDMRGLSSLLADLKKDTEALASANEENAKNRLLASGPEGSGGSISPRSLSPRKKQQSKTNFNHRMLLRSPSRQKSVSEGESDLPPTPTDVNSLSPEISSQTENPLATCSTDSSLINLDLFIQGNSEIVLLLMMEKGAACNCETVRKLWKTTLPQLGELEVQLKTSGVIDKTPTEQDRMASYNYLTYDSYIKSLSGNMLRPMSAVENDFCDTSILMKDQFEKNSQMHDITLRTHTTSVYGHRTGSQQVYYQPKDGKPQPGIPSARDPNVGLDAKAYVHLLRDQDIHVI